MRDLLEQNKETLANEYSNNDWNEASGLCTEELRERCDRIEKEHEKESKAFVKTKIIEFILDNARIAVNPHSLYADRIQHDMIMYGYRSKWLSEVQANEMKEMIEKYKELEGSRTFTGAVDFGHTCPDWDYILANGLPGIVSKLEEKLANASLTEEQRKFYENSQVVYLAVIRFVKRLAEEAERKKEEAPNMPLVAESLNNLVVSAPHTLHEALSLMLIYYEMQHNLDCSEIRTFGSLDSLLFGYYQHDLDAGIITEADARVMLKYFMYKLFAKKHGSNIPFGLCGSDPEGNDLTNPLTFMILEEYMALDVHDPKIHIRYHDKLDRRVVRMVLTSIVEGKNSFVFMNDAVVSKSLEKIGVEPADAHNYIVVGCYEPCAYKKEIPCTCNGRINIPKAIELALTDGIDMLTGKRLLPPCEAPVVTFEDLLKRVETNLKRASEDCMALINEYERNYPRINPTPIFSGALEESVEKGLDIFKGGAKYNNSSINAFGLATAVDALAALKKAVFEEKAVSLDEFTHILRNNWEGAEQLYLRCKSLYPKYGNNQAEPDQIMTRLCTALASYINGKPNGRNGVYRLGTFSIDWRFDFGAHTGATADGRKAGETLSKNMSAVLGCDQAGITSLVNSVSKVDYTDIPNGTVLDVTLHKSAVSGSDGLDSLQGLLLAYIKKGGSAVHFNVLSPQELKKAQQEPEKYQTLQVRLCGWNVYFVNLSRKEQDEFIYQLESTK